MPVGDTKALAFIYHMTLLWEVGVDDKAILRWLNGGFRSSQRTSELIAVGLLPKPARVDRKSVV